MNTLVKDQHALQRKNKVYGAYEPSGARLSGTSLVSTITGVSSTSGGGVSTMTHESNVKSRPGRERRKKARRKSNTDRKPASTMASIIDDGKDVDVFEFLVENDVSRPSRRLMESMNTQAIALRYSEDEEKKEEVECKTAVEADPREDSDDSEDDIGHSHDDYKTEEQSGQENICSQAVGTTPSVGPVQPEMEMTASQSIIQRRPEVLTDPQDMDLERYYRSQMSDSGISMENGVGESQLGQYMKHHLPPLIEESNEFSMYVPAAVDPYYQHDHQMWGHFAPSTYTPEPVPLSPAGIRSYAYPQEYAYRGTPDPPSAGESSVPCLDCTPLVFRDRSDGRSLDHPKLFRSFVDINNRVLLQMQSNITDLENELHLLDVKCGLSEHSKKYKKGSQTSTSRQFTRDKCRRADLYHELHTSLEQYYKSLFSFNRISQITSTPSASDALKFKAWLRSSISPSSKVETVFGDGTDLVRLDQPSSQYSAEIFRVVAYGILTNVFFPLLMFKLTVSVLTRLILLSLTTIISTLIMDKHHANTKVDSGHLYWYCIIGCVSVSFIAALLF